jgi:sugar transferase (PEP-CTERM/EpsH1 system associated)
LGNILYLVHRLPYPPNKGDKVRSYHLLKHLSARHRVFLGTFIDDPEDEAYVETVRAFCADMRVVRLNPRLARLRSLVGLISGEALTLPYYRDAGLRDWVAQTCRTQVIDAAVVFSSAMAQYVKPKSKLPTLVDFVDADSAKWTQYAQARPWPLSWLYRREGKQLLAFERAVAAQAARSFFVTENETDLFRGLAPECAGRVEAMSNGVDTEYFAPSDAHVSPLRSNEQAIVFTGAMDYWPNIDAVNWFVAEVMPKLRQAWPNLRFWIVGRSPAASVQALAGEDVVVTGTVPDVRPYLMHAAVVVAPLRVARGIQNKILEAMAMARPVVASTACAEAVDAEKDIELLAAESADEFAVAVGAVLREPSRGASIGAAARRRVLDRYSWSAHLSGIDRHLASLLQKEAKS